MDCCSFYSIYGFETIYDPVFTLKQFFTSGPKHCAIGLFKQFTLKHKVSNSFFAVMP